MNPGKYTVMLKADAKGEEEHYDHIDRVLAEHITQALRGAHHDLAKAELDLDPSMMDIESLNEENQYELRTYFHFLDEGGTRIAKGNLIANLQRTSDEDEYFAIHAILFNIE